MEKWALAVGRESKECGVAIQECQNHGVYVREANNIQETMEELAAKNNYLLVIIFPKTKWVLEDIRTIRSLTGAPVLVLTDKYDGAEKIASLEAGADEYIQCPDTVGEGIASARALMRRYTDLNGGGREPSQTFFRNGILVSPERRSVSIHAQEIQFQKKEFDLFCLLASSPGRVFTNEQLYEQIWGGEYIRSSDDALNSCLRRIRRKLENVPGVNCRIENRKGVGYCFAQNLDMNKAE